MVRDGQDGESITICWISNQEETDEKQRDKKKNPSWPCRVTKGGGKEWGGWG
jgi:hypothetical protein